MLLERQQRPVMVAVFNPAEDFVVLCQGLVEIELVAPARKGLPHAMCMCSEGLVHIRQEMIFRKLEKGAVERDVRIEIAADFFIIKTLAGTDHSGCLVVQGMRFP